MENQLSQTNYLMDGKLTIADILPYGYTHVADEGGFNLNNYYAIQKWINRIQSHPSYVSMKKMKLIYN